MVYEMRLTTNQARCYLQNETDATNARVHANTPKKVIVFCSAIELS